MSIQNEQYRRGAEISRFTNNRLDNHFGNSGPYTSVTSSRRELRTACVESTDTATIIAYRMPVDKSKRPRLYALLSLIFIQSNSSLIFVQWNLVVRVLDEINLKIGIN